MPTSWPPGSFPPSCSAPSLPGSSGGAHTVPPCRDQRAGHHRCAHEEKQRTAATDRQVLQGAVWQGKGGTGVRFPRGGGGRALPWPETAWGGSSVLGEALVSRPASRTMGRIGHAYTKNIINCLSEVRISLAILRFIGKSYLWLLTPLAWCQTFYSPACPPPPLHPRLSHRAP